MPKKTNPEHTSPSRVTRSRTGQQPLGERAFANDSPTNGAQAPSYDQIAEAAYHRFLKRGGGHGNDVEDWIEAERELSSRRR
jgi:hypothetical protein